MAALVCRLARPLSPPLGILLQTQLLRPASTSIVLTSITIENNNNNNNKWRFNTIDSKSPFVPSANPKALFINEHQLRRVFPESSYNWSKTQQQQKATLVFLELLKSQKCSRFEQSALDS